MRNRFLIVALCLCCLQIVEAQTAKWEIGFQVNAANYSGDLTKNGSIVLAESRPAFSGFMRRNISPMWSARLQVSGARLSGRDLNYADDPFYASRNFLFQTRMYEGTLLAEWDPLGRVRYNKNKFKKIASPYFFTGIAGVSFDPKADFNFTTMEGVEPGIKIDKAREFARTAFALPLGAGVRIDLSRRLTLGVEGGLRLANTDYLDGISRAGNPHKKDRYMFGGLNLAWRFGFAKDSDGDKVADRFDQCPELPGPEALGGCPDADKDGVADRADKCPFNKGDIHLQGCPDKDKDGTPDPDDACPTLPGLIALKGCPDTDKDGISDKDDLCPAIPGVFTAKGCPDIDNDSIPDAADKCPDVSGLVVNKGCPDVDTDKDGFIDRLDGCPEVAGPKEFKGCPDSDKDGIEDSKDECPTFKGLANSKGCPDVDNDSIPDFRDRCPEIAGPAGNNGCPDTDTDKDGVADRIDGCPNAAGTAATGGCPDADNDGIEDSKDECPTKAGIAGMYGCPDSDNDGISDVRDKCPDNAGLLNTGGCPEIRQEEKEVLKIAMQKVEFDFAKATIREASFPILNKVVDLMAKYTGHHIRIEGHTDDIGSDKINFSLSANRAEACKRYLTQKGIDIERIMAKGLGESKPLIPNTNDANRQLNRRVEFHLYVPE
jgi:OmpA-OmpF porin, OOP family